ncbi:GGDEF domain-containing protein [Candidatus Colwellia aromaticivorans]|uniref:GGDEF domain-containing protein n=1 Tax=Candidatus Colwellia aromaticivorans TaxID=2267621 RepID=UPI000DF20EB7|nr:GGDEF domain-containing protein [Candidatus Colwellia aromaticivorans]
MQTLNILDNPASSFNAFNAFNALKNSSNAYGKNHSSLLEQMQTTLDLDKLLDIIAMEAARYVNFCGLYFKSQTVSKTLRGSSKAKHERQFELKLNNEFIGTLSYGINSPISMNHDKDLQRIHQIILYPLKNALQYHQALQLAMHDGLTGLGNRRYFDEQLKRAMHNANRNHAQVGLVLGDLNKFKAINDTYGHSTGDQVLKQFANILRSCIRDSDSTFRFGGDEFAIIVEHASEDALGIIQSRIHNALKTNVLLAKYQVSCSLGTTFMNRADNEHSLIERPDQALYRQKMNVSKRLSVV